MRAALSHAIVYPLFRLLSGGLVSDSGHLELIQYQLVSDLLEWANKYEVPLIVSEYGADTIEGIHTDPPYMVSEKHKHTYTRTWSHIQYQLVADLLECNVPLIVSEYGADTIEGIHTDPPYMVSEKH